MSFKSSTNYIDGLNKRFAEIEFSEKYKFVLRANGSGRIYVPNNDDYKFELVWIDDETGEITGNFECYKSPFTHTFYIDFLISFKENNYEFLRGVTDFIKKYFINDPEMYLIQWGACIDNPVDKQYQRLAKSLERKGYQIVRNKMYYSLRTFDGVLRHQCTYQCVKPEYIVNDNN